MNIYKRSKNKEKIKAETSEYNPVPMYRAYGVLKREYPWLENLKIVLIRVVAILFLCAFVFPLVFGLAMFFVYGPLLVKVTLILIPSVTFILLITRTLRKRIRFIIKLKVLCKKNNYKLISKCGFFPSFRLLKKGYDFMLKTPTHTYYIRYLTLRRYNATLTFENDGTIKYQKKSCLKGPLAVIFPTNRKVKSYSVSFSDIPESSASKVFKVILVNPVCREFFARENNGKSVPVGSGETVRDFVVFTGTGFIESVKRNEKKYISNTF